MVDGVGEYYRVGGIDFSKLLVWDFKGKRWKFFRKKTLEDVKKVWNHIESK